MVDFETPEDILGPGSKRPKIPDVTKYMGPAVLGILAMILIFSCFYSVGPDEVGVIRRFRKYVRTTKPGLHVKLPAGIENVTKVRVEHIFKEEFGFKTLRPGIKTEYAPGKFLDQSLMLTGDLNSAVVEWIVQYKVKDPVNLLFKIRNPGRSIRDISEAMMRQVVGDRTVDEALTVGRLEINQVSKDKIQRVLDSYQSGIQIITVKLQDVNPPDEVKPSFNEVNEAKQEMERTVNQAWENYNKIIPRAKGEALKLVSEAEGYALNRINRAKGDAERFLAIWNEYKDAKEVTRRRLYLETLAKVLPKAGKKFIIDSSQKSVLPLLQLEGEGGAR